MVERTQEQNCVCTGVSVSQVARVANFRGSEWMFGLARGCRACLLHMFGRGVDQVHSIAPSGEPACIRTRPPAGVDDRGWRLRQVAKNQFLRSGLLELKPAGAQPGGV